MRTPLIAGNWKMYKTAAQAVRLVQDLSYLIEDLESIEVAVCPPFTALRSVSTVIEADKLKISLGAQNVFWEREGAYTGEISPIMLKDLRVQYVIIGHSERRQYFQETDEMVNKKVKAALDEKLIPILCVGETLKEREDGKTNEKIRRQISEDLVGLTNEQMEKLVIAYEPIWAIGTGKSATPPDANDVIRYIRALVGASFSIEVAKKVRILYGGSVTPENIAAFVGESDIDGALVGGASLDAESFARIVKIVAEAFRPQSPESKVKSPKSDVL